MKAPRITAIQQLMNAQIVGYRNPFPSGSTLELVEFNGELGRVFLKIKQKIDGISRKRMEETLNRTLSHFGVYSVEIILTN